MFLEKKKNGPPTPPLSQHFFLIETYVNVGLGEGFLIFVFFLFFFIVVLTSNEQYNFI